MYPCVSVSFEAMHKHIILYNNKKMKSRSNWLKLPTVNLKQTGRKRFTVHKNQHNIILFPESVRNDTSFEKITTQTPDRPKKFSMSPVLDPIDKTFYQKQLKVKDSELQILKNLYSDTTRKLHIYEQSVGKLNQMKKVTEIANSSMKLRTLTPEYKRNNFLDLHAHPAFMQPKYTKSNPKIMLSNPITGISPVF